MSRVGQKCPGRPLEWTMNWRRRVNLRWLPEPQNYSLNLEDQDNAEPPSSHGRFHNEGGTGVSPWHFPSSRLSNSPSTTHVRGPGSLLTKRKDSVGGKIKEDRAQTRWLQRWFPRYEFCSSLCSLRFRPRFSSPLLSESTTEPVLGRGVRLWWGDGVSHLGCLEVRLQNYPIGTCLTPFESLNVKKTVFV